MAHSNTQFDRAQIEQQAQRHDQMVQDVQSQLRQLGSEIEATLSGASSNMTSALHTVYQDWSANVNKVVLDNVGHMAMAMRAEANNQDMGDQDNTRQIMNTVSPVHSYLGGR